MADFKPALKTAIEHTEAYKAGHEAAEDKSERLAYRILEHANRALQLSESEAPIRMGQLQACLDLIRCACKAHVEDLRKPKGPAPW